MNNSSRRSDPSRALPQWLKRLQWRGNQLLKPSCTALWYLSILSIGALPFKIARIVVGPFSVPLSAILIVLLSACLIPMAALDRGTKGRRLFRGCWALSGLAISVVLPLLFGRQPTGAVLEMAFYLWVPIVLAFAAPRHDSVRKAIWLLTLGAVIWAIWGLILYFSGMESTTGLPAALTLGDRNSYSFMLGSTFFLLLGVGLSGSRHNVWVRTVVITIVGSIILAAIVLSFSRGAWVATSLGFMTILISVRFKRSLLVAASVLMCALLIAAGLGLSDYSFADLRGDLSRRIVASASAIADFAKLHPSQAGETDEGERVSGTNIRVIALQRSWDVLIDDPLIGIGAGNFARLVPIPVRGGRLAHPHNAYVHVWVEQGAIGIISFGILLLAAFTALYKRARREANVSGLATGFAAALTSISAVLLFESFHNFLFLWVFYGLILVFLSSDGFFQQGTGILEDQPPYQEYQGR
ncbi:O-antigen ligase family protein [Candidatus Bipolaricaulota bacterium]